MATERASDTGDYRLHPLSPVFEIGRSFFAFVLPGLVVLFLAAGDSYEIWYMALFVPAVAASVKRYLLLRYRLEADHLVVREGFFFKTTRHVPYARIQNLDTVQNPLHRLLGVVEVRLETASGEEPEAVLRVVSVARFEELRAGVLAGRKSRPLKDPSAVSEAGEPDAPSAFFRMTPLDVAFFGLLSQKGLALLAGLFVLGWQFDLFERVSEVVPVGPEIFGALVPLWLWLAGAVLLVALLQALTIVWAFIMLFDFHIVRTEDDLQTTCGLWTRQTATLPRHRIQIISVQERLIPRLAGRLAIKALSAGGDSTGDSHLSRKWLVPLVARDELEPILDEVQPNLGLTSIDWHGVHPGARRRMFKRWSFLAAIPTIILGRGAEWWSLGIYLGVVAIAWILCGRRARRLGYALSRSAVFVRDGVIGHVRHIVRFSKIQSVSLTQTPFDRRHRMATVRVDTAGQGDASIVMSIPYLPLRSAVRLARTLRREAAATTFRW